MPRLSFGFVSQRAEPCCSRVTLHVGSEIFQQMALLIARSIRQQLVPDGELFPQISPKGLQLANPRVDRHEFLGSGLAHFVARRCSPIAFSQNFSEFAQGKPDGHRASNQLQAPKRFRRK